MRGTPCWTSRILQLAGRQATRPEYKLSLSLLQRSPLTNTARRRVNRFLCSMSVELAVHSVWSGHVLCWRGLIFSTTKKPRTRRTNAKVVLWLSWALVGKAMWCKRWKWPESFTSEKVWLFSNKPVSSCMLLLPKKSPFEKIRNNTYTAGNLWEGEA